MEFGIRAWPLQARAFENNPPPQSIRAHVLKATPKDHELACGLARGRRYRSEAIGVMNVWSRTRIRGQITQALLPSRDELLLLRGFGLLEPEIGHHARQLLRVVQLRRVLESIVGSGEREVLLTLVSVSKR
jgi:hypothetical protein